MIHSIIALIVLSLSTLVYSLPIPHAELQPNSIPVLPGSNFNFAATFSNVGSGFGFGPVVDILAPSVVTLNPVTTPFSITPYTYTFTSTTCVPHPYVKVFSGSPPSICGQNGTTYYSYKIPYLSLGSTAPPIIVSMSGSVSTLANFIPYTITSRGAFIYSDYTSETVFVDGSVETFGVISNQNLTLSVDNVLTQFLFDTEVLNVDPTEYHHCTWTSFFFNGSAAYNGSLTINIPCGIHVDYSNVSLSSYISLVPPLGNPYANSTLSITWPDGSNLTTANVEFPFFYDGMFYNSTSGLNETCPGNGPGTLAPLSWAYALQWAYYDANCNCIKFKTAGDTKTITPTPYSIDEKIITDPSILPGTTADQNLYISISLGQCYNFVEVIKTIPDGIDVIATHPLNASITFKPGTPYNISQFTISLIGAPSSIITATINSLNETVVSLNMTELIIANPVLLNPLLANGTYAFKGFLEVYLDVQGDIKDKFMDGSNINHGQPFTFNATTRVAVYDCSTPTASPTSLVQTVTDINTIKYVKNQPHVTDTVF